MKRFPARTLVLMLLALASFVWFFVQTHRSPSAAQVGGSMVIEVVPLAGGDR